MIFEIRHNGSISTAHTRATYFPIDTIYINNLMEFIYLIIIKFFKYFLEPSILNFNIKTKDFVVIFENFLRIYLIISIFINYFKSNRSNNKVILNLIRDCISDKMLRDSIRHYTPLSEDSKIIPFLIKIRQPLLLLYACKIRGRLKYKVNNTVN